MATKIYGYLDRNFLWDNTKKVCVDAPNIKSQTFLIKIQGDKISFGMLPVWLAFVLNQDEDESRWMMFTKLKLQI